MIHVSTAPSGIRIRISRVPAWTRIDDADDHRFVRIVADVTAIDRVAIIVREHRRPTTHFVAAPTGSVILVVLIGDRDDVPTGSAVRVQVTVAATSTANTVSPLE